MLAHHAEEYDWFVKADDDTLVLVENLRRYAAATASALDPSQPRFLGLRFMQDGIGGRLFNAGAGYVLNRAALKIVGCMLRSNVSTQAPTDERCDISLVYLFTHSTERPLPAPSPRGAICRVNGRGARGRCEVAPGVQRGQDATELQSRGCVNDWSILDCQCDWWAKKANEDINMAICLRYWGGTALPWQRR